MDYTAIDPTSFRYISHHGVKGQKWGIRRYQNPDGTLTEAGKKRYLNDKGDFSYPTAGTSKPRSKQDIKIASNYWNKIDSQSKAEYERIIKISDKKEKAAAEKAFIESAFSNDPRDVDASRAKTLMDQYNNKSGNWYFGTSVTKDHANAMERMRNADKAAKDMHAALKKEYGVDAKFISGTIMAKRLDKVYADPRMKKAQQAYRRLRSHMTAIALKDIGFENNRFNRQHGNYIWEWD